MLNSAETTINLAYDKLSPESNKQKLPLEIFNTYFAPYFFGQKSLPNDSDIFATWIGIAGSPMSSVDIINTNNETVFTIPPLYNTNIINFLKANDFSSIMNEYSLHSNSLPSVSMNFVQNRLLPEADNIVDSSKKHPYIEQWGDIANLYQPDNKSATKKDKTIINTIVNNSDDGLSYDI
jgi:hypothetical protein